jgi:hypothetical protein
LARGRNGARHAIDAPPLRARGARACNPAAAQTIDPASPYAIQFRDASCGPVALTTDGEFAERDYAVNRPDLALPSAVGVELAQCDGNGGSDPPGAGARRESCAVFCHRIRDPLRAAARRAGLSARRARAAGRCEGR